MTPELNWPQGNVSAEDFLQNYWQKRPLLIRDALPGFVSPVSGDELAGLACEGEIESRIVIGQGKKWQLKQGPFSEDEFASLPPSHWTLLVQAVDHWVPEARDLLNQFRFIPDWRLDDIMISYATDGGGVGPHYDNYDVFLLQGTGQRRWQTGQLCDGSTPLLNNQQLRLLNEFSSENDWVLNSGDMLYLPPRIAHLGEAIGDNCITISVGFRAPSYGEITSEFSEFYSHLLPESKRYSDPNPQIQSSSAEIAPTAIANIQEILRETAEQPELIAQWLGQHMTLPKYQEHLEETAQESDRLLTAGSRLAWHQINEKEILFFVNGESRKLPSKAKQAVQLLCDTRALTDELGEALGDEIIFWLVDMQAFLPDE
ncbi:cupin domain-containing protein [Parendozoicomonas sp. Alg238-R29]|uniref:cupin domain-containing protein n=1 Tax=Parendozoicomonas sp. Alg238-R29 TaxID=2993446 RepID=UPI00248DD833|nr:cupin domain-containing protein [Parendozoicomonas sp. Alg238-R29]